MRPIAYVWDEKKASSNKLKHGVSFDAARLAFSDPYAHHEQDRVVEGEVRWRVIGWSARTLLLVAYVHWDEEDGTGVYRIISARRVPRAEGESMKKLPEGWVRVSGPPEMTPELIEELRGLAALDAAGVEPDCSDIPELDDDFFKRVTRGRPVRAKRPRVEPAE